jgi:proteasome accessory factor C
MVKAAINPNLERTARLLNLVPYLVAHQGISLDDLSKEFAVSGSQLLEDLNTLWMCGLPGYTPLELIDLSFDSGYVTIWNAETLQQPRSLSRDEALTLVLGLGYLLDEIREGDAKLSAALGGLIEKLADSFDTALAGKVHVGATASAAVRGSIDRAVSDRGKLKISYHSMSRDVVTERIVHPLEFRVEDEVEYIFAYCELSAGYRTFRLDRILSIESVASRSVVHSSKEQVQVRRICAEITVESRLRDASERFRVPLGEANWEGVQTIMVKGFSSDWIVREIMSFGGEACLQSPASERNLVWQRSAKALQAYGVGP